MCYTNKKRWERNKMFDKKLIDTSTDLIADSTELRGTLKAGA